MIDMDNFLLRLLKPEDDFAALVELRAQIEAADQDGVNVTEAALQEQLRVPGHNPAADRWVMVETTAGEMAGHALVWLPPEADAAQVQAAVRPHWRRQGLGTQLMEAALGRARVLGARQAVVQVNGLRLETDLIVRRWGFQFEGAYTEWRNTKPVDFTEAKLPEGYRLRSYGEVADLTILTRAMNEAYAGLWAHMEVSEAQMAEWLPQFNADGLLLVFDGNGKIAGISRTEPSAERSTANQRPTGYIDAPGFLPEHRQLEHYRALLQAGMRWLRNQGMEWIELESWGDPPERLSVFEKAGFVLIRRVNVYTKDL